MFVTAVTFQSNASNTSMEGCRIKWDIYFSVNIFYWVWWTNKEKCFYCPAPGTQRVNNLISSSDGRHVPGRWAKSWHWRKEEKQQSQEVKNWGIREIHHHSTSLTLCRAWPYQAVGLSEWRNQVVGRAARPALVWEHAQLWLHQSSWYMCIKSVFKKWPFHLSIQAKQKSEVWDIWSTLNMTFTSVVVVSCLKYKHLNW